MDSSVGLAIQSIGVLLITLLSLFMRGSIKEPALKYWITGWAALSIGLLSLLIGFHVPVDPNVFYSFYFLAEYIFGLMFIGGCLALTRNWTLRRKHFWILLPVTAASFGILRLSRDFNDLFIVHATILAVLFGVSFAVLKTGVTERPYSPGIRVMLTALFLLTLGFVHYIPMFGSRNGLLGFTVPAIYLQFTSIFDLIFEILLGFGTVMTLMERVRREIELANDKLMAARDQLELLAQMDPLTEALNRHAFHSLLRSSENGIAIGASGCVAVIDIDNLKPINDTLGHPAGDRAIRAVARAMRSLIRADDMLFRWGGDEFLVLMFKLPQAEASRRMKTLNDILEVNCRQWTGLPITVTVSHGVAGFDSFSDLAQAIESADGAMYAQRQQLRGIERSVSV
jgi:diguanylate cyclase (GGDEF)-like protein